MADRLRPPVRRRPNRLPAYDYARAGAYFVTVCTRDRQQLFWCGSDAVAAHSVRQPWQGLSPEIHLAPLPAGTALSAAGRAAVDAIGEIPQRYPMVTVDVCAVMPNHVHLLLQIHGGEDGRTLCAPTISRVVKQWKEAVTKKLHSLVWQRSFHDRVIRDEAEYRLVGEYILTNPARWRQDCFHPSALSAKENTS